ncbi:hypothetical protein KEM54_002268 [Ascosphaera aggregata]|nr:hypothetical protein KEM54_002268 [Ascosphaera aggregata]
MSFGTIYSYPNNPRVFKALVAAKLNNLDVAYPQDFKVGTANTTEEFKSKFVTGKVPAFEGTDGVNLFDSDAIAQYIAESGPASEQLLGKTAAERASIRQWISYASSDISPDLIALILPRMQLTKFNAADDEAKLPRLHKALATIDAHLKNRKFLASSEKYSLADITLVSTLWWGFTLVIGEEDRAKYPNLMKWFKSIVEDELVKSVFGEIKYTDKIVNP